MSTDGGASWQRARLHEPNRRSAWVRWSLPWTPSRNGPTELLARATSADGLRQPDRVPFNVDGYMFWAVARHPVIVGQRVSSPASITSVVPVT